MVRRATMYAALSQGVLLGSMLISHLLMPSIVFNANGISNYGVNWPTVVPYTFGFGLSALFFVLAGKNFSSESKSVDWRQLRLCQYVIAAILLLVMISTYPYQLNIFLDALHRFLGALLVLAQSYFAYRLVMAADRSLFNYMLLAALPLSAVMMVSDLLEIARLLPVGQVIFGVAFGIIYIRNASYLHDSRKSAGKGV